MKKYIAFLFIFVFALLSFNFNTKQANAVDGCTFAGQAYSVTTGESCDSIPVVVCAPGELFSSVTGQSCTTTTEPSPTPVPTVPACSVYNTSLRIGSRGVDVMVLQQILKDAGYYFGVVDGFYGFRTHTARTNYEKKMSSCVCN